ncbi:MAG TPA: riboflavin synthase [Pirellulales bacterium]|nr:riboflavin synthase [Pirellulales bacterium]
MFTGLIQALATVADVRDEAPGKRLWVRVPEAAAATRVGDSVAINGCCLTVVDIAGETLAFEAGPETLRLTNLGELAPGSQVNLETSLRVGDALGGHFVTGHVDGVGTVAQRHDHGAWTTIWFACAPELTRQMASKGSVAVDGVSLTLVEVERRRFSLQLIPHTLAVTTLGSRQVGDRVNLETDLLAKYVGRLFEEPMTNDQ